MRHYWLTCDAPDLPADAFRRAPGRRRPATLEGGKGGGSAPSYPDPYTVAGATTQTNEQSAAYNKALNLNNYSNPFGSQTSGVIGTGANGAPIYMTYDNASPQLQGALSSAMSQAGNSGNINTNALNGLYGLGGQYSSLTGTLGNYAQGALGLNTQLAGLGSTLSPAAAQQAQQQGTNAAYQSSMGYLQPQFNQQQESTAAQLANQGLQAGSQGWNNAETNLAQNQGMQQQEALNNAELTGSQIGTQNLQNQISGINTQAGLVGQQAGLFGLAGSLGSQQLSGLNGQAGLIGQAIGLGQTPYSDLSALSGLIPGYTGTGQSSAAPADVAGAINNQYQSQLAGYNANQASSNNTMNGLFGLGAAGLMALAL